MRVWVAVYKTTAADLDKTDCNPDQHGQTDTGWNMSGIQRRVLEAHSKTSIYISECFTNERAVR